VGGGGGGHNVRANVQPPTLRFAIMLEPRVSELKNLLHHRILSHIIIPLDDLLVLASVRALAVDDSWHVDSASQRKLIVKSFNSHEITVPGIDRIGGARLSIAASATRTQEMQSQRALSPSTRINCVREAN